jgi:hypothetical protein
MEREAVSQPFSPAYFPLPADREGHNPPIVFFILFFLSVKLARAHYYKWPK